MSEMIERVARAIVGEMEDQQLGSESPWHDPEFRDNAFRCARAAIAALREPTEAMRVAGVRLIDTDEDLIEAWRAMVDVAGETRKAD